jgi:hypothetical protein
MEGSHRLLIAARPAYRPLDLIPADDSNVSAQ